MNNLNLAEVRRSRIFITLVSIVLAVLPFGASSQSGDQSSSDVAADGHLANQPPTAQARAPTEDDDAVLALLIEYVVIHDIAVIGGLVPFPPVSRPAEITEYGANIALKFLPARLIAPGDIGIDPNAGPGPGYSADGCGIEFQLLSAQAEYSNLFGIANFRDPYTQVSPFRIFPWKKFNDPESLETRWGFLRSPRLYHANSDVKLDIQTPYTVRKYDQGTEMFGEPFAPVDTFAESPQQVYLPIGDHEIGWVATTQLSPLGDVAVPGVMLLAGILSEIKTARGGLKAAKQVKKLGVAKEAADAAIDPQDAVKLSKGRQAFSDLWQKALELRDLNKQRKATNDLNKFADTFTRNLGKKFRKKIRKLVKDVLKDTLKNLKDQGINSLDGGSREVIKSVAGPVIADVTSATYTVLDERLNLGGKAIAVQAAIASLDNGKDPAIDLSIIQTILKEYGPDLILKLLSVDTVQVGKAQIISVYDSVPPTINVTGGPEEIQATDFGGTRLYRARARLLELAAAASSDNCGRTPEIILNAPDLLRIGPQLIEFTARDRGPNPPGAGDEYQPTGYLPILVADTQAPLFLAPPGKVIISPSQVDATPALIGDAVAVDLADVQPLVTNDAPGVFPANSRTTIQWQAVDASGNATSASQVITVKESNTQPVPNETTKAALTAEEVEITLTATDEDELDGQFDPLWFKIERLPEHGQFVAPLYPFFVEDYRTKPGDGLGDAFDPTVTPDLNDYIGKTYCDPGNPHPDSPGAPPRNFVHKPKFVHVTDDGIRYVLDDFFVCLSENGKADTQARFSKWASAGEFLGQLQIGSDPSDEPVGQGFRIDRDGFLYYNVLYEDGTSEASLFLSKCDINWNEDSETSTSCSDSYKFPGGSTVGDNKRLDAGAFSYARIDSSKNVAYVVANGIFAYELLDSQGLRFLGEVGPRDAQGAVLQDWFGAIPTLEVGSDGALYANDVTWHRINKIAPITLDDSGEFVLGDYVGWSGKCTDSANADCDLDLERSRGYSCSYEASSCTVAPNSRAGDKQGQFNRPQYISIDPNDILYIADYNNSRIQRLSPDGSFAGEAVSEGTGINRGERPGFVLGNIGMPASVAVNSSQFFVVDQRESFVNVFGTLPFKEIRDITQPGDSRGTFEAKVTYKSNQFFPNPAVMADDSFSFSVSDGVALSEDDELTVAEVTVTVSRNYRPPEARSRIIVTPEDVPVEFILPARDPDGIIGIDEFGLDTLTYQLLSWPENGSLSGNADSWTYTPYPDFSGTDSLSFKVNDGLEDSNEGTLTFDVTAVNDPPVVAIEVPERVALGFPSELLSAFTDDRTDARADDMQDGISDGYTGRIEWGDNTSETTGDFVNEEGDIGSTGVVVIAPTTADAEGRTVAEHNYEQAGARTILVCVTDRDALEGCDEVTVNVEPLVVMGIGGIFYDEPLEEDEVSQQEVPDGRPFTFEIMIVNGEPSVGSGLPAQDVALDLLLPAGLDVVDLVIEQGTCNRDDVEIECSLGTLVAGAEVKLSMTATGPGGLIYDEERDFQATLTTSSDALNSELGLSASVELVADTTDSDADGMSDTFEATFGLDPMADDSAGDIDGDALTNVEEYNQESSPLVADTDGDGVSDGDEVAAGSDPLFDDIPPALTIPADLVVDATGTLTLVNLGTATAEDFRDGPVEVFINNPGPFPPGHNVVVWRALDAVGNRADAFQFVDVVPMVNFRVDQAVAEGATAQAFVELNGPAVAYPVTVPFVISGTATNPGDHNGVSGEVVITAGMSAGIDIDVLKDAAAEPDETIVLTMGTPLNAVAGAITTHTITVTEQNLPPDVDIAVEQQGRPTTTIVSSGGLIALLTEVRDDPAQEQSFDWSASDSALVDPVAVNDPSYLLDPSGLGAGLYDMRVSVTDDGVPPLNTAASSLLNVANEPFILKSADDSDGDGASDAAEGPADSDGDRIANYLDDIVNTNLLRMAGDGRMLETTPGLRLRLGATAFAQASPYVAIEEQVVGTDISYGYSSDVLDFEITRLAQGGTAQIVVPLANPISTGAVYRRFANGQWQDFVADVANSIASAPGERGACPPALNSAYTTGLAVPDGCLQLTLSDGGPNDADGVLDGVIRIVGGLAAPVGASGQGLAQVNTTLTGDGEVVMARFILHSDSGDTVLKTLTLQPSGESDELLVDQVLLIKDVNRDGEWTDDDVPLASGKYTVDDGELTLLLDEPLDVPAGDTDLLVVYVFGELEE